MVGDDEIKDRMSILSNDLLGLILSWLTTKEAAATSILSRRWRYLWTLSPTLDLDGTEILLLEQQAELECLGKRRRECVRWVESLEKKRREYVSWVDRVLGCSVNGRLVEFRVSFDLTNKHATHIDGWLHFAVSRKVERLELSLPDRVRSLFCFRRHDECYNFPYGKWNFPDGLRMMKKLFTHKVNVSGEALEFFLGNCPLLEQLTVSASDHLTSLQIIRTFPSFKCLEISFCNHLDSLVIRDSDLVTLKYCGTRRILDFQLLNVPLLTQLWIRSSFLLSMKDVVEMFSPLLPQLHKLKIHFLCSPSWDETETFLSASAARMSNLKQLGVTISSLRRDPTLLPLINLINASPCLQRFVVEVRHVDDKINNLSRTNLFGTRKFDRRVYPHLKEVEFVGYRSRDMFHDLIMHLVENDVALETIVVEPRCFVTRPDRPWDGIVKPRGEEEMLARAYAKEHLTKYVNPRRINVKIL